MKLKRILALVLCFAMLSVDTLPSFAEEKIEINSEAIEDKKSDDLSFNGDNNEKIEKEDQKNEEQDKEEQDKEEKQNEDNNKENDDKNDEEEPTTIESSKDDESTRESTKESTSESTLESTKEKTNNDPSKIQPTNNDDEQNDIATSSNVVPEEKTYSDLITEKIIATISDLINENEEQMEIDEDKPEFFGYEPFDIEVNQVNKKTKRLFGSDLPKKYDGRTKTNASGASIMPPIRNQNPFGTCWAFATITIAETYLRSQNIIKASDGDVNLSEAALAYFVQDGLKNVTVAGSPYIDKPGVEGNDYQSLFKEYYEYTNQMKYYGFTNCGGNVGPALMLATLKLGLVVENEDTKYEISNINKILSEGLDGKYAFNSNDYEIYDAKYINKDDTEIIKNAIMEHGSVAIAYNEDRDSTNTHQYDGEYYYYPLKPYIDSATNQEVNGSNHAVVIVGWDDEIPTSYFYNSVENTHPTNGGGWLVRNSWGNSGLMNGGYFWLSYEDPSLDPVMYAAKVRLPGKYKYLYHYDTTPAATYKTVTYPIGNIFKVSDDCDQKLEAVQSVISTSNLKYKIKIYTNDTKMDNPADGTLACTQDVTQEIAGIHEVKLTNGIALKKGTYFSVIIEPENSMTIFMDRYRAPNKASVGKPWYNEADEGQMFEHYNSYWGWEDYNQGQLIELDGKKYGYSFRIRALTNPSSIITYKSGVSEIADVTQPINPDGKTKLDPVPFDRPGYHFVKWVNQATGDEYGDEAELDVVDNITLTAEWELAKYKIYYVVGDKHESTDEYDTKTYTQDLTLKNPTITKTGYKFGGWYKESTYQNVYDGKTDLTTKHDLDQYIYAKWKPIEYTINYNLGGVAATAPSPINKEYGKSAASELKGPSNIPTGYVFDAWYEDPTFNTKYDGTKDLSSIDADSKTIYARWKIEISYDVDGHGTKPSSICKFNGEKIILPNLSAIGYIFNGWYDGSTKVGDGNIEYTVTSPKTLKAKWAPEIFEIILHDNGGERGTAAFPTSYKTGDEITLPMDLKKDGADIVGWCDNEKLTGTKYTKISKTDFGKKEFWARYATTVYITFNANGGTGSMDKQSATEGKDIKINPNKFSRDGYQFDGWQCSVGGFYGNNGIIKSIGSDVVLTAVWSKNKGSSSSSSSSSSGNRGGSIQQPTQLPTQQLPQQNPLNNNTNNVRLTETKINVSISSVPIRNDTSNSTWKVSNNGKWQLNIVNSKTGNVEQVKNSWACIDSMAKVNGQDVKVSNYYFFDNKGEMLTGWLTDNSGKKYFLNTANNSEIGKMVRGWEKIDNKYYYFDGNGVLLRNSRTPDGYYVDTNGVWVK